MKTLYLAQCGRRAVRWVASDGERALAGGRGYDPARLLALWAADQGWPGLVVILPGRYPTMADALRDRLSDNLRCVSEIVQAAADRLGAWTARIWDGPEAGASPTEGKEGGMSEIGGRGLPPGAVRIAPERPALTVDVFVQVWACLASYGMADEVGGREFCRALEDWLRDGRPVFVRAYLATWHATNGAAPAAPKVADNTRGEEGRVRDGEEA